MMDSVPRLLLLEFFPGALQRNERSLLFPFLKGLARRRGVPARWVCFGKDPAQAQREPGGRGLELGEADLRALAAELARFRPTHIISSEPLAGAARRCLESAGPQPAFVVMGVPGSRRRIPGAPGTDPRPAFVVMRVPGSGSPVVEPSSMVMVSRPADRRYFAKCGWLLDWLGVAAPSLERGWLIESVEPDYGAKMANEAARSSRAHLTIVSGVLCANRRLVRANPLFRRALRPAASPAEEPRGCAFCDSRREALTSPGADLLALVEKQFRGILKTAGRKGRDHGLYEFYDIRAFLRFDEVFAVVLRLGLPPSVFLFNPRIDDVLRARKRIARALPGLARAGHEVRILSMGIENFSERENARFNKHISAAQVDQLLALSDEWERDYPGVFRPFKGGRDMKEFGFILFTPWTTLADLRINLEAAARRRFGERGYWLYSTLIIYRDNPMFFLARRDGKVLVKRFPDRGQVYGLVKNEDNPSDVAAWRFKDACTAEYFSVLVRVCAADREGRGCAFFKGDRDFELALGLYERVNQRVRVSPLAVAFALLEALEAKPRPRSRTELLRRALAKAVLKADAEKRCRA
ncbi:MAG: hypothetical protein PHU21_03940 [Elusimicrobia bacterium]|nr:hypothetical protein [Elusimicrobiota bacterium]